MTGSTFRRLLPALVLMVAAAFPAASRAVDVRPVLKLGIDFGGDTIFEQGLVGGGSLSIKANGLFYFGGGVSILNDAKDIETELTASFKVDDATADNGQASWKRFPLEALVFYRLPQYRFGGGLTYHLSPKLSCSGVAVCPTVNFDNAAGVVLQGDYLAGPRVTVGVRYTNLTYKVGDVSVKSSGPGITLGYSF